jgi:cytochrome c
MNKILIAALLSLGSGVALASQDLAQKKGCMACHQLQTKVVGPSYKDVAAKYAKDKDAVKKLAEKVIKGGSGVWGPVPMPANSAVTPAEAETLVKWVMTVK